MLAQAGSEVAAPVWAQWIGETLRAIPGPTDAWAEIISSLAWPLVFLFLVIRFRSPLRSFIENILARVPTDHIKLGPFELTPNSQTIPLDPDSLDPNSDFSPDDVRNIEELFELVSDRSGELALRGWIENNLGPSVALMDFLTAMDYVEARARAHTELLRGV